MTLAFGLAGADAVWVRRRKIRRAVQFANHFDHLPARLKQFQRWAVWRLYQWLPWLDYLGSFKHAALPADGAPLPLL
jgi:hypothetical protein